MRKRDCGFLVVGFVFFLMVSFVSAKNISVEIPSEVEIGEEFDVVVRLIDFAEGGYDLKIEVLGEGERIAEIEGGSTYYYVKDVFSDFESKVVLEVVEDFNGEAEVVIKVRNSKGTATTFEGYSFEVSGSAEEEVEVEEEEESEETIPEGVILEEVDDPLSRSREVISLVPQSIKDGSDRKVIFKAKNEIITEYAIYGFAFFCVVIIVLLLIDKKNG